MENAAWRVLGEQKEVNRNGLYRSRRTWFTLLAQQDVQWRNQYLKDMVQVLRSSR